VIKNCKTHLKLNMFSVYKNAVILILLKKLKREVIIEVSAEGMTKLTINHYETNFITL
jgi:hypothetical protein